MQLGRERQAQAELRQTSGTKRLGQRKEETEAQGVMLAEKKWKDR